MSGSKLDRGFADLKHDFANSHRDFVNSNCDFVCPLVSGLRKLGSNNEVLVRI